MYFIDYCNLSVLKPVYCFPWHTRHCTNAVSIPTYLPPYVLTLTVKTVIVTRWLLLFVCYSIALDNTDISISNKGKAPVFTSGVEAYNKEILGDEIRRLTIVNVQLMADKTETEKIKVNLEVDRIRLFDKKNSLVAKKKEFRTEIAVLNIAGFPNVPVCKHQNLLLRPTRDKLKIKRPSPFDSLKKNFQRFFIRIRYYQGFYQQSLPFDSDKI